LQENLDQSSDLTDKDKNVGTKIPADIGVKDLLIQPREWPT